MSAISRERLGPMLSPDGGVGGAVITRPDAIEVTSDPDYVFATSPENRALMGVESVRLYFGGRPSSALLRYFMDGFVETAREEIDGKVVAKPEEANGVVFPISNGKSVDGIMGYRLAFRNGASGLAITSIPEPIQQDRLLKASREFLGRGTSQYGIMVVGGDNSTRVEGAYVVSMEGARPYVSVDRPGGEAGFFKEIALRGTHLLGGRHITERVEDDSMLESTWSWYHNPDQLIQVGKALRELGVLPHTSIDEYDIGRIKQGKIKRFLGVSGLSEGQMSMLRGDAMLITGTGTDKGKLEPNQIVVSRGLHTDQNGRIRGPITWAPKGRRQIKSSVETVDNWMVYAAAAGIKARILKDADLEKFKKFVVDNNAVIGALQTYGSDYISINHVHFWPEEGTYDQRVFNVLDVNKRHVPKGAYHSSCGTEPLSLYTTEAALRGFHEDREKGVRRIQIIRMPNHGEQMVSPFPPAETMRILQNAMADGMRFVPPPAQ